MKSLWATLALESLTLTGWIFGLLSLKGFGESPWFYLLLAHVGGGFIYLALHAVLNESKEHSPRYILFFFLIGVAVIGLANLIPS